MTNDYLEFLDALDKVILNSLTGKNFDTINDCTKLNNQEQFKFIAKFIIRMIISHEKHYIFCMRKTGTTSY